MEDAPRRDPWSFRPAPTPGPLLRAFGPLLEAPSFNQQMAEWDRRTAGREPWELSAEELANSPLMALATGTVVPFGRKPVRPIPEQSAAQAGIPTACRAARSR